MRELDADGLARENAKAVYDFAAREAKDDRFRGGNLAVANAHNIAALKRTENLQQAGQELALEKGVAAAGGANDPRWAGDGVMPSGAPVPAATPASGAGAAGATAAATEPYYALSTTSNGTLVIRGSKVDQYGQSPLGDGGKALGYRASSNYASQSRVVKGRAFYQNGNTWTDATAVSKPDLKKQEVKFNSDEYFALLTKHPEAAAWFALGNEVDVVLDEVLVSVR
jgi:hypothetical protein